MNPRKDLSPGLAELQDRLEGATGKKYWRSLDELANSPAFQELIHQKYPEQASEMSNALSRRQFLTLMGASLALAGVSGCSIRPAPSIKLRPYVRAPEEIIPGKPLFYATAMTLGGVGVGLLAESHLGRPTKIEGNPQHPGSLGATDAFHQASVLTLYDPDRSQNVTHLGKASTWDDALVALRAALDAQGDRGGVGLRLLTETIVSPTLGELILEGVLKEFPEAKWHQYEPMARDSAHRAATAAYGEPVHTYYRIHDLDKNTRLADVTVSLDADFLGCGFPGGVRYTAEFTAGRRVRTGADDASKADMNRLYVVEPSLTNTGAKADNRLALRAGDVEAFAHALAAALGVKGATASDGLPAGVAHWAGRVADDLHSRPSGTTLVMVGDRQPAAVHLLAHAINQHLGNVGKTVIHTAPLAARPDDQAASLSELVDDLDNGSVEVLVVVGGNPAYNAPADLRFTERMQKAKLRFHLSLFQDETSLQCHWHLPETHYLESWGDVRAYDGTASIIQPLIEPLYQGRSALELTAILAGRLQTPPLEMVKAYWGRHRPHPTLPHPRGEGREGGAAAGDFEDFWQTTLHDGVVAGSALPPRTVSLKDGWEKQLGASAATAEGTELVFLQDPTLYDGRFANNGWLQELPKPITRIAWDNAALMSPATAKALGVELGEYAHGGEHGGYYQPVIELQLGDRKATAPVWIVPGCADHSVAVYLGGGRRDAGKVGSGVGFDSYALRTTANPWFASDLKVAKTGRTYLLCCVQEHHLMENREVVREGTLAKYREHPDFATNKDREDEKKDTQRARKPLTLYEGKEYPYEGHKWGMSIDLTACTGCSACVVACQSENNIPVVGKEEVSRGREMHWLRIDRYSAGPADDPKEFYFQPVPCMHCENAPCEYVCPTEATVHSAEGLNEMVYQRCVGTRFCSNNCPYKVRRFNFFHYADYETESLRQQYNPDVTVRSRGVMEKCSYCVQRIRHAEIDSQKDGRPIFDGEILTACQAACPASAIIFGDINDKKSQVKRLKDSPLNYALLADLNTAPRTTYLAALRNPNPDLEAE
jgi:MoCo/4Fe-4S cofactor protein with predicted Tat translocation signal